MTVFKGYIRIMKRNAGLIIMYVSIFMVITVMVQRTLGESSGSSYSAEQLNIGFVDEDKSALSEGLKKYMGQFHEIIPLEQDKEKLQEMLFYRNVEYIIQIPAGFEKQFLSGTETVEATKVPGSYSGYYVDQQLNNFLNSVKTFCAAGYSAGEAAEAANGGAQVQVLMLDRNGNSGKIPGFSYYYRYLPYLMLSVLSYVLGNILSAFYKGDIPRRMQASAVSARRQNLEALLAVSILGVGLWLISIGGSLALYGKELLLASNFPYYIINSLAMLLVALATAFMVGMLTTNTDTLNGVVNTLTLGMCFLCGVFVPMDILSKGVRAAAQFLPVYWYEWANELLAKYGTITGEVKIQILQSVGIQIVFAAAIICIALAAKRWRLRT